MASHSCGLSFALLLCTLLYIAKCDLYYIIPSDDAPCPVDFCPTISEISSNTSYYLDTNNVTLVLLPGNHSLDSQLLISAISELRMLSNETSTTSITCKPDTRFTFYEVSTVEIGGVKFIGCGNSSVTRANIFTLWNSTFVGVNGSGTALVLNQTTAVNITECSFLFNTQGSKRPVTDFINIQSSQKTMKADVILNRTSAYVGGAIVLTSSSDAVIEDSLFDGNEAQYGGAIFAEMNSSIVMNGCTFRHNKADGLPSYNGMEGGGGGALFVNDSRLAINNCSFMNNTLVAHPGYHSKGGVLFAYKSEVSISESEFIGNVVVGNGAGGVIYASHSELYSVSYCTFNQNEAHFAGVMYLQGSNTRISQSNFTRNLAYDRTGVISVSDNSYTQIENSSFADNRARTQGGVLLIISSRAKLGHSCFVNNSVEEVGAVMTILEQGHVIANDITLSKNRASLAVISLYRSIASFVGLTAFVDNRGSLLAYNATIQFEGETTFSNSTTATTALQDAPLQEGGAITAYSSHLTFQGNTTFTHNSAKYGGALFAVETNILFKASNDYLLNSTFTRPKTTIDNNIATGTGGGIYLYHSTLMIREGHCYVTGNDASDKGGGIHAISSDVKLEPPSREKNYSLFVAENNARLGGGVYLEGASMLSALLSNSSIRFIANTADYGAAIYVDDNTKFDTCFTTPANVTPASECFFHVLDPYLVVSTIPDGNKIESIVAQNNYARQMGSNLFGGLLDRCVPSTLVGGISNTLLTGTIEEKNTDGLSYLRSISNLKNFDSIASDPTRVCFCWQGLPNCTRRALSVQVKKGESFNVSVAAVDQVTSPIRARIFSTLSSIEGDLVRGRRARIEAMCTNISYSITSPFESESLSLYAEGPCRDTQPSSLSINVDFSPCNCPIGFQHSQMANETSCECVCDPLISEHITDCDIMTESFVRRNNSWISYANQNNQSTYIICERCPFRYCQGSSPASIRINLNNDNGANVQCTTGHTGPICGTCETNYSVSLAHKRCLPCSDNTYLIFSVVIFGSILAGLGLVVSVLAINFTVAVGTINGFIFYANIVDVYDSIFLPLKTSSFPVLQIEWLNLDPGFDTCFVRNIDLYGHTWFRLLFPAYIILIIIIIIIISEHSLRFSRLIGKRNPIATLATLLLLSYTNILETAVVSLRPTTLIYLSFDGSQREELVWLPDGNVKYFQGKHIILFLVALLLILLTVAYIGIIFSWQWIACCPNVWIMKWTKNQKLNSFIEAYHAPYHKQHRYWTGLLLFVRVLLILISISTEGKGSTVPLLSIVFVLGTLFLLKTTYMKKLYKKWPVDVLETVLMFNLFVYAIFMWYALDQDETRRIVAYVSTMVTLVLLLCVLAYHVYANLLASLCSKLWGRKTTVKFYPPKQRTSQPNLYTHDDETAREDQFHEMFGSNSNDYQLAPPEPSSVPTSMSPTFSILETPNPHEEHLLEQLTSITEDICSESSSYV